ncbi:ABC transporter ATP-binding protein [Bifidobacterium adolescentis]|uniref:Diguanylate cyclase n=1 Tax=Bifidobacterium adolescentis TaxID=1680 RepID=A0A1X2ZU54_BIFAD|nr:ABC transporter ATP-binding protein [Bifidobacterium adolescentis]OSG97929.1 diguanylate cyclase [Bifidobacterium adolescentis]
MSAVIRHLNIAINGKPIVDDVDLDIADGERVGLVGSSGSGKSMIARAMMGLLPATAQVTGSVELGGTQIVGASDAAVADLRGRYVGMVFQNPSAALNPVMTVAQQVGLPLYLHYDLSLAERSERVTAVLAKVGLGEDVLVKYPHELSGGQRQRVGIATALVTSPRLIIADEPTTALDSITQRQIVDLLTSLVDDAGASMLFITHDFAVLARATTRCYVLDGGSIAETGTTASLLQAPASEPARRLVDAARLLTLPHGNSAGSSVGSRESERAQSKRETFKNTAIMRKDDGNE